MPGTDLSFLMSKIEVMRRVGLGSLSNREDERPGSAASIDLPRPTLQHI